MNSVNFQWKWMLKFLPMNRNFISIFPFFFLARDLFFGLPVAFDDSRGAREPFDPTLVAFAPLGVRFLRPRAFETISLSSPISSSHFGSYFMRLQSISLPQTSRIFEFRSPAIWSDSLTEQSIKSTKHSFIYFCAFLNQLFNNYLSTWWIMVELSQTLELPWRIKSTSLPIEFGISVPENKKKRNQFRYAKMLSKKIVKSRKSLKREISFSLKMELIVTGTLWEVRAVPAISIEPTSEN